MTRATIKKLQRINALLADSLYASNSRVYGEAKRGLEKLTAEEVGALTLLLSQKRTPIEL